MFLDFGFSVGRATLLLLTLLDPSPPSTLLLADKKYKRMVLMLNGRMSLLLGYIIGQGGADLEMHLILRRKNHKECAM